jgi:hypothetical protein
MSGRHPRVSIAPQARSLRWAGKPSPKPRPGRGASRRGGERPQAICVEAAGGELPSRANPMGHGGPRSFAEAGAARGATDLPASHGAWKGDMNGDTKAIFRKETLFQSIQRTPISARSCRRPCLPSVPYADASLSWGVRPGVHRTTGVRTIATKNRKVIIRQGQTCR